MHKKTEQTRPQKTNRSQSVSIVTPSPSRPSTANSISRRRGRDNRIYEKSPRNIRLRTPPRPLTANPKTSWHDRLSSPRSTTPFDVSPGRPFGDALPKGNNASKRLTGSLVSRGYRDRLNFGGASHPSNRHRRNASTHKASKVTVIHAAARNPSPAHRMRFTQTAPGKSPFQNNSSSNRSILRTSVDDIGQSPIIRTRRGEQQQNDRRLSTASGRRVTQEQEQQRMLMNQTVGGRPSTSAGGHTEYSKQKLRSKAVGLMVKQLHESVRENWKLVLPTLEQLSFKDQNARLEALKALLPNLQRKELNNMDHWVVNNPHRVHTLREIIQNSLDDNKAPEMEVMKSGKQNKQAYRPRAFTEYWDEAPPCSSGGQIGHSNNNRRPRTAGPSMAEKLFPGYGRREEIRFNHAEVQVTTPSKIFQQLKEKSHGSGRSSLKRTSITSQTIVPKHDTPAYSDESNRLKTTNRTALQSTMRPIYKYIHPSELGHDNRFTRMRNYQKFNNGLYELHKKRAQEYKVARPQPKFMRNTVNYDQGRTRNLYGR
eukprot:g3764.t1